MNHFNQADYRHNPLCRLRDSLTTLQNLRFFEYLLQTVGRQNNQDCKVILSPLYDKYSTSRGIYCLSSYYKNSI
jgi:hypothetical protein